MTTDDRSQKAAALLKTIQQEQGGQLKIFLGAAPGVGKTCAMMSAARETLQQGVDVVVGLVETHGRADTEALLTGFELLPRKQIDYQGQSLTEFDLDEALKRKPKLILVDELAHTNVPGSRHKRRYQDITELLAAGIDVYTTLNIQHLESLNDLILQITSVRVQETVPDRFIDNAQEIVFVDLPPKNLIERLRQGKVYLPEYARSALDGFFSPSNLAALREVALKVAMGHVDSHLKTELDCKAKPMSYVIKDKLLVLVSSRHDHEYLVRIGRRVAEKRQVPWVVAWVDTGQIQTPRQKSLLQEVLSLAKELGAETEVLRGPSTIQTIIPFISEHRINTVLVGSGVRHWLRPWRKRVYQRLIDSGLPIEVTVYRSPEKSRLPFSLTAYNLGSGDAWRGHLFSIVSVFIATAVAMFLNLWLERGSLVLIFVLAVVLSGLRHGARPAMSAALLSFLGFTFFLSQPRYLLVVFHQQDLTTFILLFAIALVCGPVATRIRRQIMLLQQSNRYSEALRSLAQELSIAKNEKAVWAAVAKELGQSLHAECCVVVADGESRLISHPEPSIPYIQIDDAAIKWTKKYRAPSGRHTDTLSASAWTFFPLNKNEQTLAVVLVRFDAEITNLRPYDKELVAEMAQQGADAWQRIQLVNDLESARVKSEVEQLRSALLASVSHDLKSPLSAITSAAEKLISADKQLSPPDRHELVDNILQESRRLDRYIQNLLDMTRLGHGTLKIERDWVSVSDIMSSAMARLKRYFPSALIEYRSQSKPPLLYAHAALIEQAIFNILENAAKYSPSEEKIIIGVAQKENTCIISIEDKGPGIPEALREKIFDMFYAMSDGEQKRNNNGMGLTICRGMIGAHGGTVEVFSGQNGKGTKFVVELPIDVQPDIVKG